MTDIFNSGKPSEENKPSATPPQTDNSPLDSLLKEIKNERGEQKYRNVEDALKSVGHAQDYILQLKADIQNKEKELLDAKSKVDELSTFKENYQSLLENKEDDEKEITNSFSPSYSQEDILRLVETTLSKKQLEEKQNENAKEVVQTLIRTYGEEKAKDIFYSKGQEVGLSQAELDSLAKTNPKAVYRIIGLNQQNTSVTSPNKTTLNTSAFNPKDETFIGRNQKSLAFGATTDDYRNEFKNSSMMVEELHAKGITTTDLSNPKVYRQFFK